MPRVIFDVLWKTILAGKDIAAYVKNRSKNGGYYWVLAFVSPIPGGFLSVRFKPSTPLLQVVESLYKELREEELRIENTPGKKKEDAISASLSLLGKRLNELGFSDYDSFINKAAVEEFISRSNFLKSDETKFLTLKESLTDSRIRTLKTISTELGSALEKNIDFQNLDKEINQVVQFVKKLSIHVERASLNLTIKSEQCGEIAKPLAVISNWLRLGATLLGEELNQHILPVKEALTNVQEGLFSLISAKLQTEMIEYFISEMNYFDENTRGYSTPEAENLTRLLSLKGKETLDKSILKLSKLTTSVTQLESSFAILERQVNGLSLAHVNGRVECSRLPDRSSLEVILTEVITEVQNASRILDQLRRSCSSIGREMRGVCAKTEEMSNLYLELINREEAEAQHC